MLKGGIRFDFSQGVEEKREGKKEEVNGDDTKSSETARKVMKNSKQRLVNAFIISLTDRERKMVQKEEREMGLTSGETEQKRAREWRVGGVEMLLIPSCRLLNERRQCVLERRLEGIKA